MQFLANLVAFISPLIVFLFWWLIGYSTLAVLYTQRNLMQNMLLAPVVGMAVTLLFIFSFNRFDLGVERFGLAVTLFLLFTSMIIWWKYRPPVPYKQYTAFAVIFLIALWLVARPLLEYGFAWLSYTNDDMSNYCLGAVWFLHHGHNVPLNVTELMQNRNYSSYFWFMFVPGLMRSGSELLLAWASHLSHMTPDKIFMPVIVAMHLTLISASTAFVYQSRRFRTLALCLCGVLSASALLSLGTFYQLIAQVGGCALLTGCVVLLLRTLSKQHYAIVFRFAFLVAILVCALLVDYPEVFPFLVLSFFAYHGICLIIKKEKPDLRYLVMLAIAMIASICILNTHLINVFATLLGQASGGLASADIKKSLFPYFLLPSGLADLWGFHAIAYGTPEPLLSLSILLGAILLITVLSGAVYLAYRCYAPSIVFLVMFALAIHLFIHNNDFGLFKLAMYMQPYMWATLIVTWFYLIKKPKWRWGGIIFLVIINLFFQHVYLERSRDSKHADVPSASKTRINYEFQQLLNQHPSVQHWILDTASIPLVKFQSLFLRDREAIFLSRSFFSHFVGQNKLLNLFDQKLSQEVLNLRQELGTLYKKSRFDLHDASNSKAANFFRAAQYKIANDTLLVMTTGKQTIVNRSASYNDPNHNFVAIPWNDVHNHLVFITSLLGQHYYLPGKFNFGEKEPDSPEISYNGMEADYFYPKQKSVGIGRHLLFEVIHPSPKVRMKLNLSTSLFANVGETLPKAAVIGKQRKLFPFMGRGSARVFSPPLEPQVINDASYLSIDMGREGEPFPYLRPGLMSLYGSDVAIDKRPLVAFARDISLISEQQYQHLQAPSVISQFPDDLSNPNLEYSGIYEDGWISEAAFFKLQPQKETPMLLITGFVPLDMVSQELMLVIDGKSVNQTKLKTGYFSLKIPAPKKIERHTIELHFSKSAPINQSDVRVVAMQLRFIGFLSNADADSLIQMQLKELHEQNRFVLLKRRIKQLYLRLQKELDNLSE